MRRETFERLKKLGIEFDDTTENLLVKPLENLRAKSEASISLPTVSFKNNDLKSVKENATTLLVFFINGEFVGWGGKNYNIELTCDSKLVTFSTTKWTEIEKGFTIKTKITTKEPEVINIGFKFNGKESNSLNLEVAANQVVKPEKCICKKTPWTANDLKFIVTELRKKDYILSQAQYEEEGKFKGNPIYVDEDGKLYHGLNKTDAIKSKLKKYELKTSFYDRNDDFDGKPLKDRIFFYDKLDPEHANYEMFSKYLNKTFKDYKITKCIQRIHFLAQVYLESNRFRATYEENPKTTYSGGTLYRGRGIKQITHDYNYLEYYDVRKGKGKNLYSKYRKNRKENFDPDKGPIFVESVVTFKERTVNEFITDDEMKQFDEFVNLLSTSIYWACDSAGWYWEREKLNNFATDADNALLVVSAKVNNPEASEDVKPNGINSYEERKKYFGYLKEILDYENCK